MAGGGIGGATTSFPYQRPSLKPLSATYGTYRLPAGLDALVTVEVGDPAESGTGVWARGVTT